MLLVFLFFFFFNDTATTEIYTLSLHDALPILVHRRELQEPQRAVLIALVSGPHARQRSEEHTSELQSQSNLVCRLLLEKKKNTTPLALNYDTRPTITFFVKTTKTQRIKSRSAV